MLRSAVVLALIAGTVAVQLQGQSATGAAPAPAPAQTPATTQTPTPAASPTPAPDQTKPDQTRPDQTKPGKKKHSSSDAVETGKPIQADTIHAQRKAAKLYLEGVHLLEKQRPEAAWGLLKEAVELEPGNTTYIRAAELARQSTVTQLVQQSSRERSKGANQDASELLERAQEIDSTNPLVLEHLDQLADEAAGTKIGATANQTLGAQAGVAGDKEDALAGPPIQLEPKPEKHSFHLRSNQQQVVKDVFRAYGIDATVHDSVQNKPVKMDIDDATFPQAMDALASLTGTFWEPLDPHRVVVAQNTRENRTQFQRMPMETVYLPGLNEKELTEASNVAKNVFEAQQSLVEPTAGTLTIRAPAKTLAAFNNTMAQLENGRSQVALDVKVIQLAHMSARETGTTFFQQTGVSNVFSEINSVLSQNQSSVQQIITSGLVPNQSTLANQIEILAILVASGQLTGTPFNQGFLAFGGGLTQSILSPGPATLTMSLNSSDTRTLDDIQLQLEDQEEGTFKIGERYPIETSSYSSVALPASLTGLSSAATAAASQNIPQIEYQDIGLTFKATPKVMRSNDVALTLDLKIQSLGGTSINSIPVLNSQQVSGIVTLKAGETAVLLSELSRSESRALNGLPGVSDIPGLQDISDIQKNQNVARLLVLITPTVVRNMQPLGHGPMLMVDKTH
jgi:general secretion pathway protein D